MSFKLFFASTFGLIKSTARIEAAYDALHADYQMFCNFEKSKEHKEYHDLELLVNSATFRQKKRELQHLTVKGSKEEAHLQELQKLEKSSRLVKFFALLKSEELKRYEKISASEKLETYKKLKAIVESPSFDQRKRKDEKSAEFAKYAEYQKLKNSEDIKFHEHFGKSADYRNYLEMKDSSERKRLEELRKITAAPEFKARIAYLEDKQKWEKTEDAAKEKRFAELQKSPQVINFLKYKNSSAFDFFRKWDLVFEDRFDGGKLDPQKWIPQSHWANQTLGRNFSQIGDLQAFTEGRNISIDFNTLKIDVRKEKTKGMQWQIPFGFLEKEFDYSSGIISTAHNEWWKHGILEAKVKYSPDKHMIDAIYLLGEKSSPQINLVEMGMKNRVGVLAKATDGVETECESISGLKAGEFYIFRLEWTAHSLVWKINNREVFAMSHDVPEFKMHLNAASIVVSEPDGSLPHRFEIDWIRFFRHAKA